jgi:hypothetical protein
VASAFARWGWLCALAVFAGCASKQAAEPPAAAGTGCAVVAGGSIGSAFADPKITQFWSEVNKQITDRLQELLAAGKYRTVKFVVAVEDARKNEKLVVQRMVDNRCNHLIQLSHAVNEDAAGKFFRFDVAVMHLEATRTPPRPGAGNAVTVGDFGRQYRYPRTATSFESFNTSQFAETVFADLQKSGALNPLR